ncbi:ABC transporter substrate-binding protein [Vibrio tapetis]|uniref:ABC transporter substrate-binding protein n=1 Tax=Vibrio tapetis subsp. tapetis TaxID=1671868 RepID=A0A2N8ZL06_9VIBR|nr:ABC transporter substrate-binding protein [Vibrio tapetis]SON52593.1 conserved protein of unknown function [Vibrio tapetis subsp. tapetis]
MQDNAVDTVHFWNGNKSEARQAYEWDLTCSLFDKGVALINDTTDYPIAEDESKIFTTGVDVFVTVAGNPKFEHRNVIKIEQPLAQGLLGKRLLLISKKQNALINPLITREQFTQLCSGVPATWADADLFRHNGCNVLEQGDLASMMCHLSEGRCDYISLGANEIESILSQFSAQYPDIVIAPNVMLQYPMPLVYYVNPANPALAKELKRRCTEQHIQATFDAHYGECIERLGLNQRSVIKLSNPFL